MLGILSSNKDGNFKFIINILSVHHVDLFLPVVVTGASNEIIKGSPQFLILFKSVSSMWVFWNKVQSVNCLNK